MAPPLPSVCRVEFPLSVEEETVTLCLSANMLIAPPQGWFDVTPVSRVLFPLKVVPVIETVPRKMFVPLARSPLSMLRAPP